MPKEQHRLSAWLLHAACIWREISLQMLKKIHEFENRKIVRVAEYASACHLCTYEAIDQISGHLLRSLLTLLMWLFQ